MDITRTFLVSAVLWLALVAHARRAQAADAPATRPAELDALIAKLGSDDFRVRDAAQALIVEMGDLAVKPMEELAEKSTDAEVKQRAQDIIRLIGASSLTKPSLVTLKFKDAPARDVYASLFEQANAKMKTWPPTLFDERRGRAGGGIPNVTVDLQKVPFWQAMLELEEQTGLSVDDIGNDMCLTDQLRGARAAVGDRRKVSVTGPFMVVVDDAFGGGMIHQLKVFVEPRIRVLSHAMEPEIEEVADANGQPIVQPRRPQPPRARAREMFRPSGGNAFDVHLNPPLHGPGDIRGKIRVVVLTDEHTAEIDNVAKANNVEKNVAGRRFLLNAMNVEQGEWFITVVAFNTNPPTPGLMQTAVTVVDAKGTPLQSGGRGMGGGDKRVCINLELKQGPNCGPPEKIQITVPADSTEIEIPFEFKRGREAREKRGGVGGAEGGLE